MRARDALSAFCVGYTLGLALQAVHALHGARGRERELRAELGAARLATLAAELEVSEAALREAMLAALVDDGRARERALTWRLDKQREAITRKNDRLVEVGAYRMIGPDATAPAGEGADPS